MAKQSSQARRGQAVELLYGRQAVRETMRAGRRQVYGLLLAQGQTPNPVVDEIIAGAKETRIPIDHVQRQQLDALLPGVNHQGVMLKTSGYPYADLDAALDLAQARQQDPLLLLLDHVQDPQNLGALLRTAEACGVHGVILPRDRAAAVTPAVVNASAGAVEHLLICQETNLVETIKFLKQKGLWIAGLEARADAQPFDEVDLSGPLGVVVGSEGFGVRRLVAEHCDWLVALPMAGRINSLNAAVAGSILLFFIARGRRPN